MKKSKFLTILALAAGLTLAGCSFTSNSSSNQGASTSDSDQTTSTDTSSDATSSDDSSTSSDESSGSSSGESSESSSEGSSATSSEESSSESSSATSSESSSDDSSGEESSESSSEETVLPYSGDACQVESAVSDTLSMQAIQESMGADAMPSNAQNSKILVIPVEFDDYPFVTTSSQTGIFDSQEDMDRDFDDIFNGDGATDTGYWESLSSYYYKTSYGKLNFTATIADTYKIGMTPRELYSTYVGNSSSPVAASNYVLESAVDAYKEANPLEDLDVYDYDDNGYLDAVIIIYSCPDYSSSSEIYSFDKVGLFWAYTYWDYTVGAGTVYDPNVNGHFWASYDFLYEAEGTSPGVAVDSHTLIHEFGHILGLDDYYDYTSSSAPTGWLDMMDGNILDHDAYSKTAMGWTSPIYVYGDAEVTINPFESSGDCIIVANSWNGTAFDEYLILELYTPTGLNEQDSKTTYTGRPRGFTQVGIKMYHVDARLLRYTYSNRGWSTSGYSSGVGLDLDVNSSSYAYYTVGNSNTPSYSYNSSYDLITLVDASGRWRYGSSNQAYATNDCLFQQGDTFAMSDYSNIFTSRRFNNGDSLTISMEFTSVTEDSATISFSI